MSEETGAGQFRCPNARHKWPSPKETDSNYRPAFFTTAYSVFSQFNKVAIVVGSVADDRLSNKKSAEISLPIFSTAKSFCVVDCVNAHELFRDDAFAGHNF